MLSACCRTFRNTKNNGLEGFSLYAAKMQREKVFSTKAHAGRCLAHGHDARFPLWRLLLLQSSLQGRTFWRNAAFPWVRFRCRRLLFLLCIGRASCGATLPRVKPDKRSVSLVVYVWSFLEDGLVFRWTHPTLVVFAKGFDLALRGPPPPLTPRQTFNPAHLPLY